MLDFTLPINPNLIIGGTSPRTHHPEGPVLQEQPNEVRKTRIKVTVGASTPIDIGLPAWITSCASGSNPIMRIHWTHTRPKPTVASLLRMRQKEEEHLGQYLARFTDERANQYVAIETLVAKKREDQKRPRGEPSRGPPSRLSRRRMERGEQTVPPPPNVPLNSTRTEIFL
ncbi:hypothetical protein B296_00050597 [Ensete ventricosum]|uniref:Retrotransposon gag domain-containing protein n=1 Tax=Ensete ventricosum TaxID=4639 RepID=A0A426YKG9_ENSVE|nr:hypothetical protein B296_00050597 [Ensete ventricosum]